MSMLLQDGSGSEFLLAGRGPANMKLVMKPLPFFRCACRTAAALPALWMFLSIPAAEEPAFRSSTEYCTEINGAYAPDARFFATGTKDRLLVDLPSLSTSVLIKLEAKEAVKLPRSSIHYEANDGIARLEDPLPAGATVSTLSIDGPVWRLQVDDSEVRVLEASECQTVAVAAETPGQAADDPTARKCLHQETRPSVATAGCANSAYLKNSCDVPVMVVVRTTQHLFSGTLPETSSIVIPPGVDHPLGCVWLSGATAPTVYDVLAAEFAAKRKASDRGKRDSAKH